MVVALYMFLWYSAYEYIYIYIHRVKDDELGLLFCDIVSSAYTMY